MFGTIAFASQECFVYFSPGKLSAISSKQFHCCFHFLSRKRSYFYIKTEIHNFLEMGFILSHQFMRKRQLRKLLQQSFSLLNHNWFEIHHFVSSSLLPRTACSFPLCVKQNLLVAYSLEYPRTFHNPVQTFLRECHGLLMAVSSNIYISQCERRPQYWSCNFTSSVKNATFSSRTVM